MSVAKSLSKIFIYNEENILLTIVSSASLLAKSIKSQYVTVLKTIKNGSLFRGGWYFLGFGLLAIGRIEKKLVFHP